MAKPKVAFIKTPAVTSMAGVPSKYAFQKGNGKPKKGTAPTEHRIINPPGMKEVTPPTVGK